MNLDTQNNASEKKLTAIRAIRKKCLDCSCGSRDEVKKCELADCTLHAFRHGRNPNISGRVMTEEQKQAARERLQKIREGS